MLQTVIRQKYVIVTLISIILGLLFLWGSNPTGDLFLREFGLILLISGTWTGLQELLLVRKDAEQQNQRLHDNIDVVRSNTLPANRELAQRIDSVRDDTTAQQLRLVSRIEQLYNLQTGIRGLGLIEVHDRSYPYSQLIENSYELTFVLNDGRTWIGNHQSSLRSRFQNRASKTRFVVVHPDSNYAPDVAEKTGYTLGEQRSKIFYACRRLIEFYEGISEEKRGALEIYGHKGVNVMATYMTESQLLIQPYFFSENQELPPVFVIEPRGEGSYYARIKSDIETLIEKNAAKLYSNGQRFDVLATNHNS